MKMRKQKQPFFERMVTNFLLLCIFYAAASGAAYVIIIVLNYIFNVGLEICVFNILAIAACFYLAKEMLVRMFKGDSNDA